ncbi:MAG TPA: aldehyde:ferredoxin oxidoreductase, partial [Euryarchaeota archaeon]|nr:aldehyde:ferredoxin oxidoreductase [Euryarchaeota archaeon]
MRNGNTPSYRPGDKGSETMVVASYNYQESKIEKGYNGRTLHVDLSSKKFTEKPVSEEMKEKFIGGKGFDLWLMWNSMPPKTRWNDAQNEIVIASGPLGGTPVYPGSGKSIVTSISPLTGSVIDSNVGGYFGPYLKFCGFDAIELQGKSDKPVYVLIDNERNVVEIHDASDLPERAFEITQQLTEKYAGDRPKNVTVVTAGPGAKHTNWGCLNFSFYDIPRKLSRYKQAGRGGIGTVFMDKNIVAIVAKNVKPVNVGANAPADEASLKEAGRYHSGEIRDLDPKQNEMARVGTTHIVDIMDDYDLLPTHNFKFGKVESVGSDVRKIGREAYRAKFDKGFDGCWMGCTVACSHCIKEEMMRT